MLALIDALAAWTIPLLIAFIPLYGYLRGVDVYTTFIEGAKEGLYLGARLAPYLISIFVAIAIFRASGALDLLTSFLAPLLNWVGIPGEVLPLALIRPLSGNGALGLMSELLAQWGPDSYIGRLASTMQGSTDTTFYVMSLYFGSVGISKSRHAVAAGLLADLAGFLGAAFIVRIFFGG